MTSNKLKIVGLLAFAGALIFTACNTVAPAAAPAVVTVEVMMEDEVDDAMVEDEMEMADKEDESMMDDDDEHETSSDDTEAMMDKDDDAEMMADSHDDDAMVEDEMEMADKEDESMMDDDDEHEMSSDDTEAMRMDKDDDAEMMDLPAWFDAELLNVSTMENFNVSDFQGKTVLVETMAIWCSNCLKQQKEVKALYDSMENKDDLVILVLDIDTNDSPDKLKDYADKHGFSWNYAVASVDVAREIGALYGDQFLNPPSTPMLIIDPHGDSHPLPFGHKSAADLAEALAPFLTVGM
jgi:thiol-disulfide isomerase/thioredoxin